MGIRVNVDRAILVYGIPDGLSTEIRKFAKVGNTYKLYTIEGLQHTKAVDALLTKYWEEKINNKP